MIRLLLAAALVAPSAAADAPKMFSLDDGQRSLTVAVAITRDGLPADAARDAFLANYFDHFDRDGDGRWTPAEREASFPLPVETEIDWTTIASGGDGAIARDEFLRAASVVFPSFIFGKRPRDPRHAAREVSLWRAVDRDGDGRISESERAGSARRMLDTLDLNGDERVAAEEMSAAAADAVSDDSVRFAESRETRAADVSIAVELGASPSAGPAPRDGVAATIELGPDQRRTVAFDTWRLRVAAAPTAASRRAAAAAAFQRSEFASAIGRRAAIGLDELRGSPSLAAVVKIAAAADRDGDGQVKTEEVDRLLSLVEEGWLSQSEVTLEPMGPSLLAALDADDDGTLDAAEAYAAPRRLAELSAAGGDAAIERASLPIAFRLSISPRESRAAFGPLAIPAAAPAIVAPAAIAAESLPAWFVATDRNRDQFISPQEFLGPAAVFARLDRDGCGTIDATEAAADTRHD